MSRIALAIVVVAALSGAPSHSGALEQVRAFYPRATVLVGLERVVGVVSQREEAFDPLETPVETLRFDTTNVGSLHGHQLVGTRISLDVALSDNLLLGLAFRANAGFTQRQVESEGLAEIDPARDRQFVLLAPRLSYGFRLSAGFGIVLRGGITYLQSTETSDQTDAVGSTTSATFLAAEAAGVWPLRAGLDLMLSAHADVSMDADLKITVTKDGLTHSFSLVERIRGLGLSLGVCARF